MKAEKQHWVVISGVALVALFLVFVRNREKSGEQQQTNTKSTVVSKEVSQVENDVAFVEGETVSDLSGHYFQNFGSESQRPQQDLEEVAMIFDDYRTVAGPSHPLPTGGNREIVEFLSGENPSGFRYLSKNGVAVNSAGELVDRWGKPLYFHFVSSEEIEIRSAGGDGEMWTSDDLSVGQSQEASHLTRQ